MRTTLAVLTLLGLAASAPAYIHVPPPTLKDLCQKSPSIRVLTVAARNLEAGVVVFEVAQKLRDREKAGITAFRLAVRPDADSGKAVLDKLPVGTTAVLFSHEHGEGKKATGYGYLFLDEFGLSVDYNAAGEFWLFLQPEPNLSAVYFGPAKELSAHVKTVLDGKEVRVPTRKPEKPDDLSIRGLLIDAARRKNSPGYPKMPLPTAWGKPVQGLQAGVRINPAIELPDTVLTLEVVVRNVESKPIIINHLQFTFRGNALGGSVTGTAEEVVSRYTPKGTLWAAHLSPGETFPIATVPIFRPGEGKGWTGPRLGLDLGENRVGMEGIAIPPKQDEEREVVLSTGYLDVPVPPRK